MAEPSTERLATKATRPIVAYVAKRCGQASRWRSTTNRQEGGPEHSSTAGAHGAPTLEVQVVAVQEEQSSAPVTGRHWSQHGNFRLFRGTPEHVLQNACARGPDFLRQRRRRTTSLKDHYDNGSPLVRTISDRRGCSPHPSGATPHPIRDQPSPSHCPRQCSLNVSSGADHRG